MRSVAVIYYWARIGAVVLVALLAVGAALRRSRAKAARRDAAFGIAGLIGVVAAVFLGGVSVSHLLAVGMLAVGSVVGFFLGGVRPLAAWLTAATFVFAAAMLLFAEPGAVAFGMSVLMFGVGIPLGQGLRPKRSETATEAPPGPAVEA